MPRRSKRGRRLAHPFPLTFSKFGQLLAYTSFTCERRHEPLDTRTANSNSHSVDSECGKTNSLGKSKPVLDSSDEDEEDGEKEVQADFAFFDPKPDDFHGVKALLMTLLDNKDWDLSGFTDLIVEQTTVGTVVKIENSDECAPFSVTSALNFGRYKDYKCMTDVQEFLLKNCPDKSLLNDLSLRLGKDAHKHGLIVSQRVVNLPYQLIPPLYDALFDEISWATEDEPTEELRKSFCFKSYIIISKIYKHKNFLKESLKNLTDETIAYVKMEDEIFQKLSSWHFCFPLHNEQAKANEMKNFVAMGIVMAVEADKIPDFRNQLHGLIDEC